MRLVLQNILLALALLLAGCKQRNELPEFKDGAKLQRDCVKMLADLPEGNVPQTAWPPSIRELKPMQVIREENKIRILLRREQGKYTLGYDVFADTRQAPSTQGAWAQKTKVKGIWIFKLQY